jgi:hypothetical protein
VQLSMTCCEPIICSECEMPVKWIHGRKGNLLGGPTPLECWCRMWTLKEVEELKNGQNERN